MQVLHLIFFSFERTQNINNKTPKPKKDEKVKVFFCSKHNVSLSPVGKAVLTHCAILGEKAKAVLQAICS